MLLVIPKKSDKIYKEECVLCFKSQVKSNFVFIIFIFIRKFGVVSLALKVFVRNISLYTLKKLHHMTSF